MFVSMPVSLSAIVCVCVCVCVCVFVWVCERVLSDERYLLVGKQTYCNTPQHTTATQRNTRHTATHRNTLQNHATPYTTLQPFASHCHTLQHTATHCNTLYHTATRVAYLLVSKRLEPKLSEEEVVEKVMWRCARVVLAIIYLVSLVCVFIRMYLHVKLCYIYEYSLYGHTYTVG